MESSKITKLTDIEHLHLRKSFYIGNCTTIETSKWTINSDLTMDFIKTIYNEGFNKLINEIIDNSVDEYIKTSGQFGNEISVEIDDDCMVTVGDNGRGISSKKDPETGKYQIELAFCDLKAGSNWDRDGSIGMNGIGGSAVNMFSETFTVNSCDGKYESVLLSKNNSKDISIKRSKSSKRGTVIKFKLDNSHFTGNLSVDIIKMDIYKRLVELKTAFPNIKFKFNGVEILIDIWSLLEIDNCFNYNGNNISISIFPKNREVSDISYVNGLDTYKGGTHLKYIKTYIVNYIREKLNKKFKTDIRNSILYTNFIFGVSISGLNKPEFNTQNKTELINPEIDIKNFIYNNKINLDKISKNVYSKNEDLLEDIIDKYKYVKVQKKISSVSKNKRSVKTISQLIDAVSKDRKDTVLFIVEGDSAKSHFPIVRDKNKHGMFPLKGKVLNSYNSSLHKLLENKELVDLMNIIGLKIGNVSDTKYFDKIAILTDADVDGDHIASMLMLFFYKYFPHLYEQDRIIKVLSPIIICKKGKKIERFYKYSSFIKEQHNFKGWIIEYNKGLGSLDTDEYSLMINKMKYENIKNLDKQNANAISLMFGKNNTDMRKEWLQGEKLNNIIKGGLNGKS